MNLRAATLTKSSTQAHCECAIARKFDFTSYEYPDLLIDVRLHPPTMAEASIKGISLSVTANNAADKRVAIVHTQWNKEIIDALVSGAKDELLKQGVKPENVLVVSVGSRTTCASVRGVRVRTNVEPLVRHFGPAVAGPRII